MQFSVENLSLNQYAGAKRGAWVSNTHTLKKYEGILYCSRRRFSVADVTGIVGRADVLACVFFLLSFLAYHGRGNQLPNDIWLSVLLGGVSMLAKETGITVLLLNLLYDLYRSWNAIRRETVITVFMLARETVITVFMLARETVVTVFMLARETVVTVSMLARETVVTVFMLARETVITVFMLNKDTCISLSVLEVRWHEETLHLSRRAAKLLMSIQRVYLYIH
ncbi:unnamed protein product [Timema podura]|uniref:Uncharacterized protein n=1 Tax=Timema podura TaxID=61482 RepID=A0ABN7NH53_TIMPD|nr:unnamed protein product [Timema podura]